MPTTRRRVLRAVGASIALGVVGGNAVRSVSASSDDWPQFGYNGAKTGYNPDATGVVDDPEVVFIHESESTEQSETRRSWSPVVSDGIVYYSVGTTVFAVAEQAESEEWTHRAENVVTTPTVHADSLFVGTADGIVLSLDPDTGETQWEQSVDGSILHPVTFADDMLHVGTSSKLYELTVDDGDIQQEVDIPSEPLSPPSVHTENTILAAEDGPIRIGPALDIEFEAVPTDDDEIELDWDLIPNSVTRDVARFAQSRWPQQATPVLTEEHFYNPSHGLQKEPMIESVQSWEFEEDVVLSGGIALAREELYFGTGDGFEDNPSSHNSGQVYALDSSDGSISWQYDIGSAVNTAPAIANEVVYVTAEDGFLYAFGRDTGELLWDLDVGETSSSPVAVSERVYVVTADGTLVTVRESDESESQDESATDDSGPGFGVPAAMAAVGTAGYLLKQRLDDEQ